MLVPLVLLEGLEGLEKSGRLVGTISPMFAKNPCQGWPSCASKPKQIMTINTTTFKVWAWMLGRFQEMSKNISGTFPGCVQEMSGNFPEILTKSLSVYSFCIVFSYGSERETEVYPAWHGGTGLLPSISSLISSPESKPPLWLQGEGGGRGSS